MERVDGRKTGVLDRALGDPRGTLALWIVLLILCIAGYHGVRDNYLFNDDFSWMRAAREEMTPGNLLVYQVVSFFRPLVNLSFWTLERLSPGNAALAATINLLLHAACAILVFHLLSRLLRDRTTAALAAILFAVTTSHAAAVLWISARTSLLSTLFALAALLAALPGGRGPIGRTILSSFFLALALAAKETAVATLPLLLLVRLLPRDEETPTVDRRTIAAAACLVAAYLVLRQSVMGGFLKSDWGPGLHALRNLGGGFLAQLYPRPLLSIMWPAGNTIPVSTHPFSPEIVALPLALLLLWTGERTRRRRAFRLAVGWMLLALLPAVFFRYRFFSSASITQSRYYYLSSVGAMLVVAELLLLLLRAGARRRRIAGGILVLLVVAGALVRLDRLEKKWDEFTGMYRNTVAGIVAATDERPGARLVCVEDPPMAFPYLADALALERPGLEAVAVDGVAAARARRPCLYIRYEGDYPRRMRIEMIE